MGVLKRNCRLAPLGVVLAALVLCGARAGATVGDISGTSISTSGSFVVFPKVIADGTRDTIIALTNTSNTPRFAHCTYLSGEGFCAQSKRLCNVVPRPNRTAPFGPSPDCPIPGEQCVPFWQELDFDVVLTRQQPTMWRVSTGRISDMLLGNGDGYEVECEDVQTENPFPPPAFITTQVCPGFGPGQILPPVPPFRGQLLCYETDTLDGVPMGGNSLKGEAIIQSLGPGFGRLQVSKYNSINFEADSDELNSDFVLRLNNGEYNVCPQSNEMSHYAQFASDRIVQQIDYEACEFGRCFGGGATGAECAVGVPCGNGTGVCYGCPVRTEITLVPCSADIELQTWIPAPVDLKCVDELELETSVGLVVDCWTNIDFRTSPYAECLTPERSEFYKTRIVPSSGVVCLSGTAQGSVCNDDGDCFGGLCGPSPGVLAVVEEFHEIVLPPVIGPAPVLRSIPTGTAATNATMIGLRTGVCRNNTNVPCSEPFPGCDCIIDQFNLPPLN